MPDTVIIVNKKMGQTPLDCINEAKIKDPSLSYLPMTYAGRLDPLARGVLVLLAGDECLKKDEYLALPKEYEVDVLFGFATDTYDVMGKIVSDMEIANAVAKAKEIIPEFTGRFSQTYPPYSSRTVKGKPLFQWVREGKIDEVDIPSHDVFVNGIEIIGESKLKGSDLLLNIKEAIGSVSGDFRQAEIFSLWEEKMKGKDEVDFGILKLKINCSSGVYVRGIANSIGERLGIPSLAFNIIRTKVGEYNLL